MLHPSLKENGIDTTAGRDKKVHTIPTSSSPKVNVRAWLEFERA